MDKESLLLSAGLAREQVENLLTNNNEEDSAKELLHGENSKDIRAKTDLTDDELRQVALLFYYARITSNDNIKLLLYDLLYLKISKDRKSRKEFVEVKRGQTEEKKGFFSGLMNNFNRG